MSGLAIQWDEGKYSIQKKLGNYVQFFQLAYPTNSLGIPSNLVTPAAILTDLLDYENPDDVPEEVLEASAVPIEYLEGIPTIDGLPMWERLEGEPIPSYNLFKDYRDMAALYGTRSMVKLSEQTGILPKYLHAAAKVYNWGLRCRVYDAIRKIEAEKIRTHELEKLQKKHTKAAESILERGLAFLEEHPEQMNPKIALQMVDLGIKAGRLALGLSDKAPAAGTNISIQAGQGSVTEVVTVPSPGKTEDTKTAVDNLQSILHILDSSGAFNQAKAEIIEAQYEDVDDSAAVEGTN